MVLGVWGIGTFVMIVALVFDVLVLEMCCGIRVWV